jgi:2-polyprenyl-3-methyl-5-hydroxy-6-metoxy-1,4-benzoquinol methylase
MENSSNNILFLEKLVSQIENKDKLHSKKIKSNIQFLSEHFPNQLDELIGLVKSYFINVGLSSERVADDYLKMIRDMRIEGIYFFKYGKYRCENQTIANDYVYSKPDVMSYYMNALLVSQVMWKHHFNIFMYFQTQIKSLFKNYSKLNILDIGPGHGFFSYIVKKEFPKYETIDIVDISETSLEMTNKIIGTDGDKIRYFRKDVFDYGEEKKYDFIVLGEVLEHLDDPKGILNKLSKLLNPGGVIWITVPTNSPALDHVYLFKTKEEIVELVTDSGLRTIHQCNYFAEEMDEVDALKFKITNLVGIFCVNI